MVALSLKISVGNVVKTMQFEPSTMVYDACRVIRERVPEAQLGQREFSFFLSLFLFLLSCSVFPLSHSLSLRCVPNFLKDQGCYNAHLFDVGFNQCLSSSKVVPREDNPFITVCKGFFIVFQ